MVLVVGLNPFVQADTKSYVEYTYDKAGNIVGVLSVDAYAPPVISELDPNEVRAGRTTSIIARGAGLLNARISSNSSNLTIQNTSSSISQAVFDLTVAPGTPLGSYLLTFTTPFGSVTATVTVLPEGPDLLASPAVVVAAVNGRKTPVYFSLSEPDQFEHTLTLLIADGAIATLYPTSIRIVAGSTEFFEVIHITGYTEGQTKIIARSPRLGNSAIPVYVSHKIDLPKGNYGFSSPPLGVVLNKKNPVRSCSYEVSSALGVVLNDPNPVLRHSYEVSSALGVVLNDTNPVLRRSYEVSPALGVVLNDENSTFSTIQLVSQPLGVVFQAQSIPVTGATQISPPLGVEYPDEPP